MKHQVPESMKFKKLMRLLNSSKPMTVGLLELLWVTTQKNAPRGDIGKFDNLSIAIECGWEGDADELVSALIETGWLDEDAEFRLIVHDWKDHAPYYIRGIVAKQEGFACPSLKSATIVDDYSRGRNDASVDDYSQEQRNLTKPNLTKRNLTKPNVNNTGSNSLTVEKVPTKSKRKKINYSDEFEAWWKTYHSRAGKTKAGKAFEKLTADERDFLHIATANYGRVLEAQCGTINILHGSTFINERFTEYDDETTEQLIAEATRRHTPPQAGDHLLKPLEKQLAQKEAEAEAGIIEGHIVEDKTPLIGEITAQDVAEHEQMQNSDFYQFLSNLNTNP